MILDSYGQFAAAQALSASGVSSNALDFSQDRNIGIGEGLSVLIDVSAIDAASGDETYSVAIQAAAPGDAAFGSPVVVATAAIARGIAVPSQVVIPLPADLSTSQYLRLSFTLGGTTPSITYTAYLVPSKGIQNVVAYPSGFSVA